MTESIAANARPQAQVAVVSPQQLYLDALQRLLRSPAYTIVGAGGTLEEALQDKTSYSALSLVVYNLDADEEVEQKLDSIVAVQCRFPQAKTVILANCRQTSTKLKVIQAGIEAILSRDISVDVLRSSLELVLLGKCIVPAELARPLFRRDQMAMTVAVDRPLPAPVSMTVSESLPRPVAQEAALLSSREHQILQCLINGLTNKAIARDLDISEATVKVHVKALLRKTRLANRTQAAIWALSNAPAGKLLLTSRHEEDRAEAWLSDDEGLVDTQILPPLSQSHVGPVTLNGSVVSPELVRRPAPLRSEVIDA
jgi:two-component system nitrate/nitrite response regulator NarL